ncbi:hypothetical protein [Rosistilla oblonga]
MNLDKRPPHRLTYAAAFVLGPAALSMRMPSIAFSLFMPAGRAVGFFGEF